MNTRILMGMSAIVLGVAGFACLFMPQEFLATIGVTATGILPALIQILGSLYFAFAMVNWMAKGSLIGGIYNRPVAIGNLLHFAVGAITLIKLTSVGITAPFVIVAMIGYVLFALAFAMIVFGSPVKSAAAPDSH